MSLYDDYTSGSLTGGGGSSTGLLPSSGYVSPSRSPSWASATPYNPPKLATADISSAAPAAPYTPPAFPQRIGGGVPYSTQNPQQKLEAPTAEYKPNRDIFSSIGDVIGQVTSGNELNLANWIPFLAERLPVAQAAVLGSVGDFADSILGKQIPVGALFHAASDLESGATAAVGKGVGMVTAPIAAAMQVPLDALRTANASSQADKVRALADPNLSLDQFAASYKAGIGPAGQSHYKTVIDRLRSQGLDDAAIRKVLFDAIDLPTAVKSGVVENPKADVRTLIDANGGLKWAYGSDAASSAANFVGDSTVLVGEIAAASLLTAGVGGMATSAAAGTSMEAPLAFAARGLGFINTGVKISVNAGVVVYGGTKLVQAIAQTAGAQQAYDFANSTLMERPLSEDPNTAFVAMMLFGMEGAGRIAHYVASPVTKPLTWIANRGMVKAVEKYIGSTADLEGKLTEVAGRMYADTPEEGAAIVKTMYGNADGSLNLKAMVDDVFGTALDMATKRLPAGDELRTIYSLMPDAIQRTTRMVTDQMDSMWKIVLDEPEAMATFWRTEAWNHHMLIPGVQYNADAMGVLTTLFRQMKEQTGDLRAALDSKEGKAVVGMVDQVPPDVIRSDRAALAKAYPNPTDVVDNAYVTHLLATKAGYRDAMRDYAQAGTTPVKKGYWTRADLEGAMDQASIRFAEANGLDRRLAHIDSLPEDAPLRDVAAALQTDEKTVFSVMSDKDASASAVENMREYVVAKGIRTREETAPMTAEELRSAAQAHMKTVTEALYERGRTAMALNTELAGLRKEFARYVQQGKTEMAAEVQRRIDTNLARGIVVRDPIYAPATSLIRGARKEADYISRLQRHEDNVARQAQAVSDVARIADLSGEADRLISPDRVADGRSALQVLAGSVYNGRFIGNAPRWSEAVLDRMAKAVHRERAGFDNPIDAANWIHENWRKLDSEEKRDLVNAMGGFGRGKQQIGDILAHGKDEAGEWMYGATDPEEWARRVEQVANDYEAIQAGWRGAGGEGRMKRLSEKGTPLVEARLQLGFIESLRNRASTITRNEALAEFRSAGPVRQVQMMKEWGFDPEAVSLHSDLGIADYWEPNDYDFKVNVHPANVKTLKQGIEKGEYRGGGTSGAEEDAIAAAAMEGSQNLRALTLFDTDRILGPIAADELRAAGKLRWVVDPHLNLIDWNMIDEDIARKIAARADQGVKQAAVPGALDGPIRAGGAQDSAINAAMRGEKPTKPTPPVQATEEQANRMRTLGPTLPTSYKLGRQLLELNHSLAVRVNEKILARPELQEGVQTLGAILHASSAARPNTIEGVLVAYREIENGNAALAGIGDDLLAKAQVAANELVNGAIRDVKDAGFYPGVVGKGIAPWMAGLKDYETMRELFGKGVTIADPSKGLAYGIKKAPKSSFPYESISTIDRLAAASGKPGIFEELMSGRFQTYGERMSDNTTRQVLSLIAGEGKTTSAFATRDPFGYLFGKLTNRSIADFVHEQYVTRLIAHGASEGEAEAVWRALGEKARTTGAGSIRSRSFLHAKVNEKVAADLGRGDKLLWPTIHNMPNDTIELTAREAVRDYHAGKEATRGDTPKWALEKPSTTGAPGPGIDFAPLLREAASPILRHLEDGFEIGGRMVKLPFNDVLSSAYYGTRFSRPVTSLYHIFRFASDMRFLAMEAIEPYALGLGRAAFVDAKYTGKALMDMDMATRAEGTAALVEQIGGGSIIGTGTRRLDVATKVWEKLRTPKLEAAVKKMMADDRAAGGSLVEDAAREMALNKSPELRAQMESFRKDQITGEPPTAAEWKTMLTTAAEADPELLDAIQAFSKGDTGAWLDALDAEHQRIMSYIDPEVGVDAEIAAIIAKNPHLAEIATRVGEVNKSVWADVRETMYGRADRSRAERALNHPLMWWPLSYQIKATMWLGRLLFHDIGGIETHSLGAYELDKLMAAHNEAMTNDPNYSQALENHRTLLFIASMLLPITPDQISVSASPLLQVLVFNQPKNIAAVGPIYTVTNLLPKARGELWKDIGSFQALHDTPLVGEGIRRTFNTIAPNSAEWNDTGWSVPANLDYTP